MTAARYNTGKPELGYVLEFPTAIKAFARVKELGAVKYDRGNWRKGGKPDNEYLDACLRHLVSFVEGEYYADDSGCAHLAHAMWNIMALMELNYPGQIIDKEVFDKMMKEWAERKRVKAGGLGVDTDEQITVVVNQRIRYHDHLRRLRLRTLDRRLPRSA